MTLQADLAGGPEEQVRLHGGDPHSDLVLVPSRDGRTIDEDDVIDALGEEIAVAVLPSVLYRSGQLLDIARLAKAARERDIILCIDAAHSVGAVPHYFHDDEVDSAVWCSYKYLNAGPGSVAGLFVHEKHHHRLPGRQRGGTEGGGNAVVGTGHHIDAAGYAQ